MATRKLVSTAGSKVWYAHTETWPVIGCIGVAVGWCGFMSFRHLLTSPDVQWNKTLRGSTVRENQDEGAKWTSHKKGFVDANIETIAMTRRPIRKYSS